MRLLEPIEIIRRCDARFRNRAWEAIPIPRLVYRTRQGINLVWCRFLTTMAVVCRGSLRWFAGTTCSKAVRIFATSADESSKEPASVRIFESYGMLICVLQPLTESPQSSPNFLCFASAWSREISHFASRLPTTTATDGVPGLLVPPE